MNQKQVREIFEKLPRKRKQVLLGILAGHSNEKIMVDAEVPSNHALTGHLKELYNDFQINTTWNDADDKRSGQRKRPLLIALFAKAMPDLVNGKSQTREISGSEGTIINPPQYHSPIPCTAYKEDTWVGREEEIRELSQKLRKECRILIITGITGQGKTALAERLASVELGVEWQRLSAVNFDDGVSRDFVGAADVLLTRLGETVTPQERSQPEILLNRLVQKLRTNRYLVQIDSVEVLLQKGDENPVRNEFEDQRWWEFFKQLLAGGECQSRLILTSQHLPTQFSKKYNKWHNKSLSGLSETEQLQLFSKLFEEQGREILPDSEAAGYLLRMGNTYEGHPLLIEVLAGEILEHPYNGNVVAYWRKHQQEFAAIAPAKNSEELERNVKDRVRVTLKRLEKDSPYAYGLLLRSSVYRLPVTEDFWLAMLQGLTDEEKSSALQTLKYRYLLEEVVTKSDKYLLRQHNLIRNVADQHLIEISNKGLEWKDDHYIAAQMWGTAYQPEPDASNLEQVRGYLEAFHHYCEVEDWERAGKILLSNLDTPTQEELHNQLSIWGYYREQIELFSRILGKLNSGYDAIFSNGLGMAYHILGDYHKAIHYYLQCLDIAQSLNARAIEGKALGNLGNLHFSIGNYYQAIKYYKEDLEIARKLGDLEGEGIARGNLGNAYSSIGNYLKAIDLQRHSWLIAQAINNRQGEGTALGNLGNTYNCLEDYHQAIKCCQEGLAIAQSLSNRYLERNLLINLGIAYCSLGDNDRAIEHYRQAFSIAKELGDLAGEGTALSNWGVTLIKLKQYSQAQEYLQKSLKINIAISDRTTAARNLNNLAVIFQELKHHDRALEYCEQALALATELGIPLAKECQKLKEELLTMEKEEQEKRI